MRSGSCRRQLLKKTDGEKTIRLQKNIWDGENVTIQHIKSQMLNNYKKPGLIECAMSPGFMMRKMGLEPTRCTHHKILSLARLPVPTLPLISAMCDRRCRRWDLNPHYVAITGT